MAWQTARNRAEFFPAGRFRILRRLDLFTEDHVGRAGRAHDRNLRGGPGVYKNPRPNPWSTWPDRSRHRPLRSTTVSLGTSATE